MKCNPMAYEESDDLIPEWISTSTVLSQDEVPLMPRSHETSERCPHEVLKDEERKKIGET